jgi:prepilin-type N-terminal cleavage/methylation domain-containing protein/prepilin-type processing-associated H-X9-DG protein
MSRYNRSPVINARRTGGFTLVELLVVIGIIALLVSILLPALNRVRAQATSIKCLANLRSIGQAIVVYANNNKGSLPYGFWDGTGGIVDGVQDFSGPPTRSDWATLLAGTVLSNRGARYDEIESKGGLGAAFQCPDAAQGGNTGARTLHYAAHPRLMPQIDDRDFYFNTTPATLLKPYKISQIKRSAEIVLIFDAITAIFPAGGSSVLAPVALGLDQDGLFLGPSFTQNGRTWNYLVDDGSMDLSQAIYTPNRDQASSTWFNQSPANWANLRWRHGKDDAANFVFADGHAESRKLRLNQNADLKLRNVYVSPPRR